MQFANLALGQGDNPDAGKDYLLEQGRHVLLVSADSVQCLGHHHVAAAGAGDLQQILVAGVSFGVQF